MVAIGWGKEHNISRRVPRFISLLALMGRRMRLANATGLEKGVLSVMKTNSVAGDNHLFIL